VRPTIHRCFSYVAMHHSLILFCDYCLIARSAQYPLPEVVAAFINGSKLLLRAGCCFEVTWIASEPEREQIREYWLSLSSDELQTQQQPMVTPSGCSSDTSST
jgi:hypothetical protein